MDHRLRQLEREAATGDSNALEQLAHLRKQAGLLVSEPIPKEDAKKQHYTISYQVRVDQATLTLPTGEHITLDRSQLQSLLSISL